MSGERLGDDWHNDVGSWWRHGKDRRFYSVLIWEGAVYFRAVTDDFGNLVEVPA